MSRDLRATGMLSVAIMGSRVLGLAREMVFAALFGAGAVADAYQVAFRIPNLLRDLFAEGALSSAFVPTFTETMEKEGPQAARHLGNLVLTAILAITGLLTVLGMFFAEPLVVSISQGFGNDPDKVALAVELTRLMMPILALVSVGAVWMGMLNAQRRFVAPAIAPAMFNVVSILTAAAVWWASDSARMGIAIWAGGTLLAGLVQTGMQLVALWRGGYRPALRVRGLVSHPGIRRIGLLMGPAIVGVAAVQISVFANTRFAGGLGDGAVAQLTYAFRLFFLPLGMFGVALATVTTTSVSEAAAKNDRVDLARRTADSSAAAWMLTSASAVGLWLLAEPIVVLIYRYGAVSSADALAIAFCLRAYVVGLVPYSMVKILAPAYFSVDRPQIPLVASALGVVVSVTFNGLTYRELGAPGIALGTSLGAWVNFAVLRGMYGGAVAPLPREGWFGRVFALALANGVLAAVVFGGDWGAERWLAQLGSSGPAFDRLRMAIALPVIIGVAFGAYVLVLRQTSYPGARLLASLPGRLLRRFRPRRG